MPISTVLTQRNAVLSIVPHLIDPGLIGWWGVVVPEGTTNLCYNPSFEGPSASGWNGYATGSASGTSTVVAANAYKGQHSYRAVKTTGALGDKYGAYFVISITATKHYTFSVYASCPIGAAELTIDGSYGAGGAAMVQTVQISGSNWKRYSVTIHCQNSATVNMRVYLTSLTGTLYFDCAQIEAKPYATTYCDLYQEDCGRDDPYNAASPISRSSLSRKGGRVVNLKQFRFTLLAMVGLGMSGLTVSDAQFAVAGGGYYQRSVANIRQFTLSGTLDCVDKYQLAEARQGLIDVFFPSNSSNRQKIRLIYQPMNDEGESGLVPVYIDCVYVSGLEGNFNNFHREMLHLTFRTYLPYIVATSEKTSGTGLSFPASLNGGVNGLNLIKRDSLGNWSSVGNPADANYPTIVDRVIVTRAGDVYTINLSERILYRYTLSTNAWSKITVGTAGHITALAEAFDGRIYLGGTFTGSGLSRMAYYAPGGGSLTQVSTGADNGEVKAIKVGNDGRIWFAGSQDTYGGVTKGAIVVYDPVTAVISAGSNPAYIGNFTDMEIDKIGRTVYVMAPSGAVLRIDTATLIVTDDLTVPSHAASTYYGIAFDPQGNLWLAGSFTVVNGTTAPGLAVWNGVAWLPAPARFDPNSASPVIKFLDWTQDGLYLGGSGIKVQNFTILTADAFLWTGSAWQVATFDMTGGVYPTCAYSSAQGDLYFGVDATPTTVVVPISTTVANGSAMPSPAVIYLTGPMRVLNIRNSTNQAVLNFDFVIGNAETIRIETGAIWSIISDKRGDVSYALLPGSSPALFTLMPGDNKISIYTTGTNGSSVAWVEATNTYNSLDGVMVR